MNNIDKAYNLAKQVLRSNYKELGIYAGKRHFDDYWARDSFFASFAALILKDYDIVKKNLLLFIKYQKSNGEIPLRVGNQNDILKYLGIKIKKQIRPRYKEDKNTSFSPDQNLLFIIIVALYVKYSKDKEFAKTYYKHFEKAMDFIVSRFGKGLLLSEKYYSTWDDTLKTRGFVLYSNVLFYQALKSLSYLSTNKKYLMESNLVKKEINKKLWNGSYFSLMNYKDKRYDYFNTSGNLLAIFFDLADKKQALSIFEQIKKFKINEKIPSLTNYPRYSKTFIYFPYYLINMGDYHNQMSWPWIGGLNVAVLAKTGKKKDANKLLEKLSKIILRDGNFYEFYDKNGKPFKRLFYRSESNFSWSAAFFIIAYNYLRKFRLAF